jgi:putative transcriptional regulator
MTIKKKTSDQILNAVHNTAADLHKLGFIDQRKMRKYDALCLDPIPEYDSETIRSLRDRYQISQAVLASLLNTSTSAARQWETYRQQATERSFPETAVYSGSQRA